METVKISVEVSVNLSKNTQDFITSLFSNAIVVKRPAEQPEIPAKPAANAGTEAKVPAKPAEQPEIPAKPAEGGASISIESVRKVLAEKVNEHRDEIKAKLTELGAPSVTRLNPEKYEEMYNFLKSL